MGQKRHQEFLFMTLQRLRDSIPFDSYPISISVSQHLLSLAFVVTIKGFDKAFLFDFLEGGDSGDDALLAHRAAADGDIETLSRAIQADPAALEYQDSDGV